MSLLSPELAQSALQQIDANIFYPYGQGAKISVWIAFALLLIDASLFILILTIKLKRHFQKQETFWLFKQVRRSRGNYWIPHGSDNYVVLAIPFTISEAMVAFYVNQFYGQHQISAAWALITEFCWIALVLGGWLSMVAHVISVVLLLDAFKGSKRNWMPSPMVTHLFTYGIIVCWIISATGLGAWQAVLLVPYYSSIAKVVSLLQQAINGAFSNDNLPTLLNLQQRLTSDAAQISMRATVYIWTQLSIGYFAFLFYMPMCFVSAIQLKAAAKRRAEIQRSARMSGTGVGTFSNTKIGTKSEQSSDDSFTTKRNFKMPFWWPRRGRHLYVYIVARALLILMYGASLITVATLQSVWQQFYRDRPEAPTLLRNAIISTLWIHAIFNAAFALLMLLQISGQQQESVANPSATNPTTNSKRVISVDLSKNLKQDSNDEKHDDEDNDAIHDRFEA